jgi:CheY-like chemotaxis protein
MSEKNKAVLVVNNDEEASRRIALMLNSTGLRTTSTWSGLEALELLSTSSFDLVLVADYLPDMYVGEFLEMLKKLPIPPAVLSLDDVEGGISLARLTWYIRNELNHVD